MKDPALAVPVHLRLPADPSVLSVTRRTAALDALDDTGGPVDVLVIGGGVTGAGCALDAATRGLSVILVEAGDLAIGTSSRSGKTFHGGLRYLEQLNFSLVRHAIIERDLMVNVVAPHLSRPAPFLYPLTKHWERPYAGSGILLYDLFGLRGHAVPRHRHFTRRGAVKQAPSLDGSVVTGGIRYYDVMMDDARHTMTVARTAAAYGAQVITRAPVVELLTTAGRISGAVISDTITGRRHTIRARTVINAAGVWAADLQQLAGAHTFDVVPSKGVHLLVRGDAINSDSGILARATDSIIIARHWLGHWLVGTTDTPWDGDKGRPVAEVADVEYLLRELNHFMKRKISADDVLGVFAGVRPLLEPVGTGAATDAGTTSALSRDHSIVHGPAGLVTIVGGKYTTYRLMAADTVDAAVREAGLPAPASVTAKTPLIGGAGYQALKNRTAALADEYRLPVEQLQRLQFRYGTMLSQVLAPGAADPQAIVPRADWAGYLPAELRYAATAEGAMTLADVMERRTHLAIELPDGGMHAATEIAELLADILDWDAERVCREVDDYRAAVAVDREALEKVRAELRENAG